MTPEPTNAELLSEADEIFERCRKARECAIPLDSAVMVADLFLLVKLLAHRLRVSDTNCAKAIDQLATATARVSALEAENAALRARCEAREEWPKEKEVTV